MTRLMLATAVAALTAGSALANVAIENVDLNGDSFASMEEVKAVYPDLTLNAFNDLDTNGDNRLSSEEVNMAEAQTIFDQYQASDMEMAKAKVVLDADADGFISIEDFRRGYPMFTDLDFEAIDTNDDNRVSYEEVYAPESQDLIARYQTTTVRDIAEIDMNGDEFADFDELSAAFPGLPQTEFEEIDMNGDNRISSEELYSPEAQNIVSRYGS